MGDFTLSLSSLPIFPPSWALRHVSPCTRLAVAVGGEYTPGGLEVQLVVSALVFRLLLRWSRVCPNVGGGGVVHRDCLCVVAAVGHSLLVRFIVPICISYSPFLRRSYPSMPVGCVGAAGLVGTNAGVKAFVGASLVIDVGVVADAMVGVVAGT